MIQDGDDGSRRRRPVSCRIRMIASMVVIVAVVLDVTPVLQVVHAAHHPHQQPRAASIAQQRPTVAIIPPRGPPRGGGGGGGKASTTPTTTGPGRANDKGILRPTLHDRIPPPPLSKKVANSRNGVIVVPWNQVGNALNVLSLLSVLYLGYNYLQTDPQHQYYGTPPFSQRFLSDGFCTKNRFKIFTSSHAACFVADLLLSFAFWQLLKNYQGDIAARRLDKEYLTSMLPISTLVHGTGHLLLSILDPMYPPDDPQPGPAAIALTTAIYFAVFYALFAASSPTMRTGTTYHFQRRRRRTTYAINGVAFVLAALAAFIWNRDDKFHSIQVGFTYVQTLTMVYAAIVQLFILSKESKTLAYAAWAALVTFMVNAVGWWVALDCEKTVFLGLKQTLLQLWGHLWYDSYLAISYILFLFFALKFIPAVPPPQEMKKNWGQRLRFWAK